MTTFQILKFLISAGVIVLVTELAKRNNFAASIIHSLPIMSLLAFIWLYVEKRDKELIASHAFGTFWFVLPTLPMFLVLPWLLRKGWGFWQGMGACVVGTFLLYLATMYLLKVAGVKI
ncbi:MAG: DUF3147 family protein [Verrucomicrobium sp.]|nr:DUF3147 family protein [Verrucomicrobium sp.]